MNEFKNQNDNHIYILVVVDAFTRYAFTRPLKNKQPSSVIDAFRSILADNPKRKPYSVFSDAGGEFENGRFKNFMKSENINYFTAKNDDVKAFLAERLIRTLKGRLYRYFDRKNNFRWIDVLQDVTRAYNNSVHRSLGVAPATRLV